MTAITRLCGGLALGLAWLALGASHARGAAAPGAGLRFTPSAPPAIVYENETVNLSVGVANHARDVRDFRLVFAPPGQPTQVWRLTLGPGKETAAYFPWTAAVPESAATVSIRALAAESRESRAGGGAPLWAWSFQTRDATGDLAGVEARGGGLAAPDGVAAVLVNRRENETDYRRWAPVKAAVAAWNRGGAPRWLMAPPALLGGAGPPAAGDAPRPLSLAPGRGLTLLPHADDPLAAMLDIEKHIPAGTPLVLALAWGFHESYSRHPRREFARALDLAIDRLRLHNPRIQIVLATPPPVPGEAEATERYAEEIRRLAREHHAGLIDWQRAVTERPDWESLYALPAGDGSPDGVTGLHPNKDGAALLKGALPEALW